MTKIPYSELLQDPRWQKKRLEILEYAGWRCQICGAQNITLHVHHSRYIKNKKPWQYPSGSLIAVCKPHHEMLHPEKKKKEETNGTPVPPEEGTKRFEALRRSLLDDDPRWEAVVRDVQEQRPLIAHNVERSKFDANAMILTTFDLFALDLLSSTGNKAFLQGIILKHYQLDIGKNDQWLMIGKGFL